MRCGSRAAVVRRLDGGRTERRRAVTQAAGEAIEAAGRRIELLVLRKSVGKADGVDALQPNRLD